MIGKLKDQLNQVIKDEYANTDQYNQYIEVYLENGVVIVSFLKRQHAEEFMRHHHHLLDDYDFRISMNRVKADDIYYTGRLEEDIEKKDDYLEIEDFTEINKALDEIQQYIYNKTLAIHAECKLYEELSDEWMAEMAKVAPLVDVHNYISSKKRRLKYKLKE